MSKKVKEIPEWLIPKPPFDRRPAKDHPNPAHLRQWKDEVILRDGNYCQMCRKFIEHVAGIHVHHLDYARFGREVAEDGALLCVPCHDLVTDETRRRRWNR